MLNVATEKCKQKWLTKVAFKVLHFCCGSQEIEKAAKLLQFEKEMQNVGFIAICVVNVSCLLCLFWF